MFCNALQVHTAHAQALQRQLQISGETSVAVTAQSQVRDNHRQKYWNPTQATIAARTHAAVDRKHRTGFDAMMWCEQAYPCDFALGCFFIS